MIDVIMLLFRRATAGVCSDYIIIILTRYLCISFKQGRTISQWNITPRRGLGPRVVRAK